MYYSESTETGEKGITRNQKRIYELVSSIITSLSVAGFLSKKVPLF